MVAGRIANAEKSAEDAPCSIIPRPRATWKHGSYGLSLSGAAATCLVSWNVVNWSDLDLEPRINSAGTYHSDQAEGVIRVLKAIAQCSIFFAGVVCTFLQRVRIF